MSAKKFNLTVNDVPVIVEAEQEGNARYMVRMSIPGRMARIRIGYLTGAQRTWLAEFFGGKRQSVPAVSAKNACRMLAEWASRQASVQPFMASQPGA
jgi:hypothetical protein